jgi:hypothetical protein
MLNKIIIPLYMSLEIWCHCVSSSKKKRAPAPASILKAGADVRDGDESWVTSILVQNA